MSEYRTPPKHPRTRYGPARVEHLQRERERSSLACFDAPAVGALYRLRVDYGTAYALLVRGTAKRAPSMIRELDFTYSHAIAYTAGRELRGTVQTAGLRIPTGIRIGTHRGESIRQVRVGAEDDCGGLLEGWIIGQVGELQQAWLRDPKRSG